MKKIYSFNKTQKAEEALKKSSMVIITIKKIILVVFVGIGYVFAGGINNKVIISNDSLEIKTNPDTGYKIKVMLDTVHEKDYVKTQGKEVRFISPSGQIARKIILEYKIWKKGKYWYENRKYVEDTIPDNTLILVTDFSRKLETDPRTLWEDYYEGTDWVYRVNVFDSHGKMRFSSTFKTFPDNDPTMTNWQAKFSGNGNSLLVYYKDSISHVHIEMYDLNGKLLAQASNDQDLMQIIIAPDGKLVCARTAKTVNGTVIQHIFILDVETGRTKILRAEGEKNKRKWSIHAFPLANKRIQICGGWRQIESAQSVDTNFDEVPDDLSTLFSEGSRK